MKIGGQDGSDFTKALHILNRDQKRKVAGLGVMIFIGALMEMIGVGLIMPVVEGVMAPDQLLNKWYIQILERFIHLIRRISAAVFDWCESLQFILSKTVICFYRHMCSLVLSTRISPIRSATCWRNI